MTQQRLLVDGKAPSFNTDICIVAEQIPVSREKASN
jgi:hypothetical protein